MDGASFPPPVRCRYDGGSRWVDPMEEEACIYTQKSEPANEIVQAKRKREPATNGLAQETPSGIVAEINQDGPVVPLQLGMNEGSICQIKMGEKTAKMRLLEICAANCWTAPSFTLVEEKEVNHQKRFTYKVTIEVDSITMTLLECFSEPKPQKEDAQNHAAEGALWYLKHLEIL